MSYEEKIEVILDNRLEFAKGAEANIQEIENVKMWLSCEWQCSDMEMSEFNRLNQFIDELGKRKFKDL